ncbi:MAG: mechanosensitive ion channel [Xenococcaceae cyanobacterium MO_207.B15]|nr:mechanosensitive ion channel [Xenococcaceae cyanobacterium MO_207.B15]
MTPILGISTDINQDLQAIFNTLFSRARDLFTAPLISVGDSTISLLSILKLTLSFIIVIFLSKGSKFFLKKQLLGRLKINEANQEVIATVISYGVGLIGFLVILETTGFNLASLTVIIGGLGVGIGFGLQDVTKNFVSGLTLLVERTVKVGDFVQVEEFSGKVKEVSLRSTLVQVSDGRNIVFPNSHLVENRIINWSLEKQIARIEVPVKVAYNSDPLLVTEVLLNAAYQEKYVLKEPPPEVLFQQFGDNGLHFVLCVSTDRIERKAKIISSLNFIVEYFLRERGIVMPLPQRDIWIRNPEALTNHSSSAQRDKIYNELPNKNVNLRDILPQISYFRNCDELQLRKLIEAGYRHQINKSELLYRPGDTSDEFYIILSGALELIDEKLDRRLRTIEAGKIVGEIGIMLGIPRQITLRAIEDTNLFVIKAQVFKELLQDLPSLAEQIATDLTDSQKILVQHKTYLQKLGLIEENIEESTRKKRIRDRIKNIFYSPRKKLQKNDSNHNKVELEEKLKAGEKSKLTHTSEGELAL